MAKVLHSGLVAPGKDQLLALSQLKESTLWPVIKAWLEDSLKALGGNAFAEPAVFWAAGSGQTLTALIEHAEGAAEKLREINNQKAGDRKPLLD